MQMAWPRSRSREKRFDLTHQINPDVITGVQLERKRGKNGSLKLHQGGYIEGVLTKFGMQDFFVCSVLYTLIKI